MKISIFGAGYVGLVTGTCFSELGYQVICCDIDETKIQNLKQGKIPIYEPDLPELVKKNISEGRLEFTLNFKEAVLKSDYLFIAVGTPTLENKQADLTYVEAAARSIGEFLEKDGCLIISKSTVPVGTAQRVAGIVTEMLDKRKVSLKFGVVSNPEFLREGRAIEDFMMPDRIVVGAEEDWVRKKMEALYAPLTQSGYPLYMMDIPSAEMSKYASNVFIAARISLINEIANISELLGADIEQVRKAVGADSRVGLRYLYPGVGYGGSCFPKDVQALASLAKQKNYPATLINGVELVNEAQKEKFFKKIISEIGNLTGKKIAVWGLAFKPNTDDMRSAPSVYIIKNLLADGASVTAFDPVAGMEAKKIFGDKITVASDMYSCLKGCEALIIVTEWPEFKEADLNQIKSTLSKPVIFDGRNIYAPERMKELGFTYISVGRPKV